MVLAQLENKFEEKLDLSIAYYESNMFSLSVDNFYIKPIFDFSYDGINLFGALPILKFSLKHMKDLLSLFKKKGTNITIKMKNNKNLLEVIYFIEAIRYLGYSGIVTIKNRDYQMSLSFLGGDIVNYFIFNTVVKRSQGFSVNNNIFKSFQIMDDYLFISITKKEKTIKSYKFRFDLSSSKIDFLKMVRFIEDIEKITTIPKFLDKILPIFSKVGDLTCTTMESRIIRKNIVFRKETSEKIWKVKDNFFVLDRDSIFSDTFILKFPLLGTIFEVKSVLQKDKVYKIKTSDSNGQLLIRDNFIKELVVDRKGMISVSLDNVFPYTNFIISNQEKYSFIINTLSMMNSSFNIFPDKNPIEKKLLKILEKNLR